MSLLALPPELLRVVLCLVNGVSLDGDQYRRLGSFSLVHSSWRPVVQSLLPREIILSNDLFDSTSRALSHPPFDKIKTHKLRLTGDIEELLVGRERKRWLEVETLDYAGAPLHIHGTSALDLDRILVLKNLRTLHLANTKILPISSNFLLPGVSRLVLGRNLYFSHQNPPSQIFPTCAFPSLRQLTLLDFRPSLPLDQLLSSLLPQITTLALQEPHYSSFERVLAKVDNCERLALRCRTDDILCLLRVQKVEQNHAPRQLALRSLHLESSEGATDELKTFLASEASDWQKRRSSDSAAHHHQPYKTETLSSTDSAPSSTVTPETSSTSAPAQSTVQPSTAETTAAAASTEKATPASASSTAATAEGEQSAPKAEGSTVADGAASAQTEYPEQSHAGKVGLGPNYKDGSGFADQVKAKSEILKGKLTHNPELVEQGHLRESGALAAQARKEEINDDSDSPFARPDDGEADKKPENPKAEDVKESGHEARTAAATSGTKST
ncbi:hypothetical protein JCM11491_003946 [Sporobolomyces phaffii]